VTKVTTPKGYETTFEYNDADRLVMVNKQVSVDSLLEYVAKASLISERSIFYPEKEYGFKLYMEPDLQITAIDTTVEYDARVYEIVSSTPLIAGVSVDTSIPGLIKVTGMGLSITEGKDVCGITFSTLENVKGTGYVTISPESTYVDGSGHQYRFTEVVGKTAEIKAPDMNGDGEVKADDFTVTALLKGKTHADPSYHEKYDIDADGMVDIPDLDYIKDWLFKDSSSGMIGLEKIKFYEKFTNAVYSVSSQTETRTTSYGYDNAGNITSITDCNANQTIYGYDINNRLISVTDQEGNTSRIFYSETGKRVKEILPENYDEILDDGPGTCYEYDSMGRLSKVTDAQGNVVQKLVYDINGNEINYSYNSDGLLTGRSVAGDDIYNKYLYNRDGTMLAAINNSRVNRFGYTAQGWLQNRYANGVLKLQYEYDKNGSVTGVTDEFGNISGYGYDTLGRLETVLDGANVIASYIYNEDSTIDEISYGSGITAAFSYDRDRNITSLMNKDP